jgi:N-acetylglucosaminyldiphosphoundecaprenol N-acetyl-beta-D-mannosaminyltransferase
MAMGVPVRFQQILGIRFIVADAQEAIDKVSQDGGLVVVPAAPALKNLTHDKRYRDALLGADFAITDSALMVLLWNLLQGDRIPKLSGLKYLRTLIRQPELRELGASFWVMPAPASARHNSAWLCAHGIQMTDSDVYVAPTYGPVIGDSELLRRLEERRPRHVILCLGGGIQEPLGFYLKQNLSYRPAIHCIGAAIAFLSGDQVRIPVWVDHSGLGWLWRSFSNPKLYGPRYWNARALAVLILRYRDQLPALSP